MTIGQGPHFFYEMAEVLTDGADEEVEYAIIKMAAAEAAWAKEERGRFLMLTRMVPVLRKLAEANRWRTVLRVSEEIASAKGAILGGTSELMGLLEQAPPEFSADVASLEL